MRKNLSAAFCFLFAFLIFSSLAQAQTAAANQAANDKLTDDAIALMRQDIRSERKKIVAANLPLTADEAVKFWPVYDQYVGEHTKIWDGRYALIKEYANNYQTMTPEQANSFIKRWTESEVSMAQLRLKWMPQFEKVISPKKTAMFFQIDRRLGLMVELQLSSQIPLVNP